MVKTIQKELLLELVFGVDSEKNEHEILQKSIPLFLRKLNCFFAVALKNKEDDFEEMMLIPFVAKKSSEWESIKTHLLNHKRNMNTPWGEHILNGIYYYAFQLNNYGVLLLGRKIPFNTSFKHELKPVVNHLGKALIQAVEREEKKNTDLQRIKLVEELKISRTKMLRMIEEYRQTEIALRTSEAQIQTLIQTLPDAVWLKDINGKYLFCNKMFEQFTGINSDEIIGKTDHEVYKKKIADIYVQSDRKVIELGKTARTEESNINKDTGAQITSDIIKTPIFSSNGSITGVLGISHDITERKQHEKALKESQEKYRLITESTLDIIFVIDNIGKILFLSGNVEKILGYKVNELIGQSFTKFVPQSDLPKYLKQLKNLFLNKKVADFESKIYHKNGHLVNVEINGKLVKRGDQNVGQGTIKDITYKIDSEKEIKLKNSQLIQLNAEKDKFFSIIAHDLRTPFNSFLGLTQIMAEELPTLSMDQIQQFANSMRNSAVKLFSLLENLLQWAKVQQGLVPYNPSEMNLLPSVKESTAVATELAKDKNIEIDYKISDNIMVYTDRNILQTIMRNLITNAIKFTSKNGKIKIKAKLKRGKKVEISVKDTGIGMSQKMIDNLFRLDIQTNREGTEGEVSSGLGLFLCKEFIEMYGGEIWVESAEGRGSTFFFTVPLAK